MVSSSLKALPILFVATVASAQDSVTSTYGDWSVTCDNRSSTPVCEASTTLRNEAQQVVRLAIGHGAEGALVLAALLPINAGLSVVPTISAGEQSFEFSYSRCDIGACLANLQDTDGVEDAFASVASLKMGFALSSGQSVTAELSTKGFSDAVAALNTKE